MYSNIVGKVYLINFSKSIYHVILTNYTLFFNIFRHNYTKISIIKCFMHRKAETLPNLCLFSYRFQSCGTISLVLQFPTKLYTTRISCAFTPSTFLSSPINVRLISRFNTVSLSSLMVATV